FDKNDTIDTLVSKVGKSDFIFHLAGVNRPENPQEFYEGNRDLTQTVVDAAIKSGRKIPILMSSSTQAERDNDYGKSKLGGEEILKSYNKTTKAPICIYRLPNVFGKWCRPNYNSVVATWCYNFAHDLPIQVNDETVMLNLLYIDDVVNAFIKQLDQKKDIDQNYYEVIPVYQKSLGEIRDLLLAFKEKSLSLDTLDGFDKSLYETYKNYTDKMES
ncbi:MAG TPA: NAD-dependent epimerase/dehydratase family protein, partial [Campylobacterales bacterium]|nr:NAD-dependent epimerase/dehydratase family protein [Campylobacterales bacterium]